MMITHYSFALMKKLLWTSCIFAGVRIDISIDLSARGGEKRRRVQPELIRNIPNHVPLPAKLKILIFKS